jgi:ActR/RegA family two-component response regulator
MVNALEPGLREAARITKLAVVVDPSAYWSRSLTLSFEQIGYDTSVATGIETGLELCMALEPSLVVSEVELRGGSGLDFLRRARARSSAPFVLVTSLSSILLVRAAHKLGCAAFLTKPTTAAEICEMAGILAPAVRDSPTLTLHRAAKEYLLGVLRDAGTVAEAARRLQLHKRSLRRMLATCLKPAAAVPSPGPP